MKLEYKNLSVKLIFMWCIIDLPEPAMWGYAKKREGKANIYKHPEERDDDVRDRLVRSRL